MLAEGGPLLLDVRPEFLLDENLAERARLCRAGVSAGIRLVGHDETDWGIW